MSRVEQKALFLIEQIAAGLASEVDFLLAALNMACGTCPDLPVTHFPTSF